MSWTTERLAERPLRLFVAADVPDDVKALLADTVAPWRGLVPGARWAGSDGWHVTLKFLGSAWPRLLPFLQDAVTAAAGASSPFGTRLTSVGVFPNARRARVLWAGLEDPGGRFERISSTLDTLMAEHVEPEDRAFTPHLTLARLNPPRDLAEFARDLVGTSVASRAFEVDRLVLYRSHLSPKGARYEVLLEAPFAIP